jgi:hypothetical protein
LHVREEDIGRPPEKRRPNAIIGINGMHVSRAEMPPAALNLINLQRSAGNAAVAAYLRSRYGGAARELGRGPLVVSRQPEDDEAPGYPPDWQHGAPTKPVPPDPHVLPTEPPPTPDQGGPYRTPGERPKQPEDETSQSEPSIRERIAEGLRRAGVPAWAVSGLIVLVIAALADPEPFSKVAALIGAAAAIAFFALIGRSDAVPGGATTASAGDVGGEGTDNLQQPSESVASAETATSEGEYESAQT